MFAHSSGNMITGGTFNSSSNRTSRGMDILMEWVATGAFHDSRELYDAPKCHPHTRVAVLGDIMQWVNKSDSVRDDFILWLFGPAGAGKSAIAKRIAEIVAERGLLIADFFFSRTSPTRSTTDRLIATLAYQLALSISDTRSYIEDAIELDPAIFHKSIATQIDTLLIRPLQSVSSSQIFPSQKLIIIDGLDECNGSPAQVAILEAISRSFPQHNLPIKFLLVSRPEPDLVTSFNCNEPLKSIHRRLVLDDTYQPDNDIRRFFSDKFKQIRLTHPLRSTIPTPWPTQEMLRKLVAKSSGQFIYASTVVKFVESNYHRPAARLNIILGVLPPGRTHPFAELDALYNHLLSSVDDIQLTLCVLSFYVMMPTFSYPLRVSMSPELFLSLEPGDIELALISLSSIVKYHRLSGRVEVLHASLIDFLSDRCRSAIFYIDTPSTCIDFVRRIFQYVKGPDGTKAGHIDLLGAVLSLCPWIPEGQLRSDILNFDFDAFITASIRWRYKEHHLILPVLESTIDAFNTWNTFLHDAGLEDRDETEALDRLNEPFESRLKIYRSDRRLQPLVALAVTKPEVFYARHGVPYCRCVDILLEMEDHNLHLVDQHALDLRHLWSLPQFGVMAMVSHVDGDTYASTALHCMRFLSNPPKYFKNNEMILIDEWKATCELALIVVCGLLEEANVSPELVQFISNRDIHPVVEKYFPASRVWEVHVHILALLSRAGVCPNWRIISAIERSPIITGWHWQLSKYARYDEEDEEYWRGKATWHLIRQRLDQCCSNAH